MAAGPSSFTTSLWTATAEAAPETPPLNGRYETPVLIVGGGFTGLSTALHLAEKGIQSIVIEAEEPGWGASGRNGGQAIPGLKHDPETILADMGETMGERMIALAGGAPDRLFAIVEKYGIACGAVQSGWISGAHNGKAEESRASIARQWAERGAPVAMLDKAETDRLTGSPLYCSAMLDKRGGRLNPLSYARGLARAAQGLGVTVAGKSPATRLKRLDKAWEVTTPQATVVAEQVVLATNGYSDSLFPGLKQSIVPVFSAQVASAPLSDNIRRTITPEGHVLSDVRKMVRYFRLDDAGRLAMGGRGNFEDSPEAKNFEHIKALAYESFPQLGDVEWEYRWCGKIAMTVDSYPHLHEPEPGLLIGLGYNGRGVAMATAMGTVLAARASGTAPEDLDFPMMALKPMPFHGLRRPVLEAIFLYRRLLDRIGV